MTPCPECKGEGQIEGTIGGGDGTCEQDVMLVCSACCGLGYLEACAMLKTLVAVRTAHTLALANRQPGLGNALACRVSKAIEGCGYHQARYAEASR